MLDRLDPLIRGLRYGLLLFFYTWAVVWFGVRAAERPDIKRSAADRLAVSARRSVTTMAKVVRGSQREHLEKRLQDDDQHYAIGELGGVDGLDERLYLLHYRYLGGDLGKVLLQCIKTGEVAKEWRVPLPRVFDDLVALKKKLATGFREGRVPVDQASGVAKSPAAISILAPMISDDMGLLFHVMPAGHLYQIDADSRFVWRSDEITHHSLERDADGNLWTCAMNYEHPLAVRDRYREEAALCLTPDGERVAMHSLTDMLQQSGLLEEMLYATPSFYEDELGSDPFHMNDVQPALADGAYWKRGDLFLSLRHKSAVIQYRPSVEKIVFHQQGPWLAQHDITLGSDDTFTLFNNNTRLVTNTLSDAGSSLAKFDFATNKTVMIGMGEFATRYQGRQVPLDNGQTLVESTGAGGYVLLDPSGATICRFFVPFYSNAENAMAPCWSRLYLKTADGFEQQG
ncbi:MAG: arylsulfotransferase family protein, partial [Planctomycetota bacterium]